MSKSIVRSIKNVANGYSSVQKLVRNATSNDPSGPTTYDMEELASYTHQSQTDFLEIMDMLDRRLNDKGKNWRHIAKSLTVLDYLVRYGSEKCVLWAKDNIYIVKTLREFIHFDDSNQDQGAIIRVKAKELVSLLQDDERLRHERELANRSNNSSERRNRPRTNTRSDPYDSELQRALELSRRTAEEETRRAGEDSDDADLQAALKLSLEEEEMRKNKLAANNNLLDLSDENPQPQYYMTTGFDPNQLQQQQLQQQLEQQQQMQLMQNYQQQLQQQQQLAQQQWLLQQQGQQYNMFGDPNNQFVTADQQRFNQPMFTGFDFANQQPQQEIQPLKTGSNNPFALPQDNHTNNSQSLDALAQKQQQQPLQYFTQPAQSQPIKPQTTSGSKFNDSTHGELNNLLAQGTGIDTFGNTGATRIPHQHTQTQQFINSSGTGYKPQVNDIKLSSNATGNPFLNTGMGYQAPQQQQQPQINPAYTGYGFGNAQPQQQRNGNDASLIDI